jgi:hypothetical protein
VDLKSGYWQMHLHLGKDRTTFSTGHELWQFMVTSLGIINTPATFQWLMETVLRGLTYESCLVCLNDVIVIGRIFQKHLFNLRKVFQMLPGNPPKAQSREVPTLSEGRMITWA